MSRNIPKKIKVSLKAAYDGGCAFKNCFKPAAALHHTKRFAYCKLHEEGCIVPLCKLHHELVHAGLIENELELPGQWELIMPKKKRKQFSVDKKWQELRDKIRYKSDD